MAVKRLSPWQEPDKDGWWYYPHPVEISQEISITLIPTGFGKAQFQLEVDAVQAANRAKDFCVGQNILKVYIQVFHKGCDAASRE